MKKINQNIKSALSSARDRIRPYFFDHNSLSFKKLDGWFVVIIFMIFSLSFSAGWILSFKNEIKKFKQYEQEEEIILIKNGDKFSKEKLVLFLKELNVKFPEIIYAQAKLESGDFKSPLVRENTNYFGMRDASFRPNLQIGLQNTYGVYCSWRQSVEDYVMFYCCYLRDLKTKEQYYEYLEKHYSETTGYSERVRNVEHEYFEILKHLDEKNSYEVFNTDTLKQ